MGEVSALDMNKIMEQDKEEYMIQVKKIKNASRNLLSERVIRGEWNAIKENEWGEMLEKYKASNDETLHKLVVSEESADTALHIAVSTAPENIVELIVGLIEKLDVKSRIKILKLENRRKNTPLHLAAARGIAKVCKRIASMDQTLIDPHRNEQHQQLKADQNKQEQSMPAKPQHQQLKADQNKQEQSMPASDQQNQENSLLDNFCHLVDGGVKAAVNEVKEAVNEAVNEVKEAVNEVKETVNENFKTDDQRQHQYEPLMDIRNEDDETPLFMAALHGQNEAFFALHLACHNNDDRRKKNSKRSKDGDNILHCAVAGDHFDLAFYITGTYNYLVYDCNDQGLSPLHLIASKPAAFKSGSNLGWLDGIIYDCVHVGQHKVEEIILSKDWEHHGACLTFFQLIGIGKFVQAITGEKSSPDNNERDVESGTIQESQGHNKSAHGAQEYGLFPSKYRKCFDYVMLKVGHHRIKKIKEEKEKHTWTLLLVDRMVKVQVEYEHKHGKNGIPILETLKSKTMKLVKELFAGEKMVHQKFDEMVSKFTRQLERTPSVKWMESSLSWVNEIKEDFIPPGTEKSMLGKWMGKMMEKMICRIIGTGETPLLVASKNGVTEMIEIILKNSPAAIKEVNFDGKNVVHFAVENRQLHVYNLLLRRKKFSESAFRHIDNEGNSALHLAATLPKSRPNSTIPGPALLMQWEINWFEFIKNSFHSSFFTRYNHDGQTAEDVFTETHEKLVRRGSQWLNKTSQSCSVVAAIIAPVAFSTSATISNNVNNSKDKPHSKEQLALDFFSISSLIALCSSIISVIIFLAITNARHREEDFKTRLPRKFLVALSALLLSIIATLISFCSTHFLTVKDILKFNVFPVYSFLWVAVPLIVLFQFPLYPDFLRSIFTRNSSSIQARSKS